MNQAFKVRAAKPCPWKTLADRTFLRECMCGYTFGELCIVNLIRPAFFADHNLTLLCMGQSSHYHQLTRLFLQRHKIWPKNVTVSQKQFQKRKVQRFKKNLLERFSKKHLYFLKQSSVDHTFMSISACTTSRRLIKNSSAVTALIGFAALIFVWR